MKSKSLLLVLSICILNVQAIACRCVPRTIKESYSTAGIIVKATIIKAEQLPGNEINKYTGIVSYTYKGVTTSDTITVYANVWGPSCGIRLDENETYLIYGSTHITSLSDKLTEAPNAFWTNRCTRTKIYDEKEAKELMILK